MPRKARGRRVLLLLASALPLLATEEDQHPAHQPVGVVGAHPIDDASYVADSSMSQHDRDRQHDADDPVININDESSSSSSSLPSIPSNDDLASSSDDGHAQEGNGRDEAALPLHERLGSESHPRGADDDFEGDEGNDGSGRSDNRNNQRDSSSSLPQNVLGDAATMATTQFTAAMSHRYSMNRCSHFASCYDPPYLPPWELGFMMMASPCLCELDDCCDNQFLNLTDATDACATLNESAACVGRTKTSSSTTSFNESQPPATAAHAAVSSALDAANATAVEGEPRLLTDEPTTFQESNDTDATGENTSDPLTKESGDPAERDTAPPPAVDERFVNAVDYASKSAGGLVIDKSPNFHGTSNLLTSDRDRYAIVECREPAKWVVIGLSEDILVKRIGISMLERYSSHVKDFSLLVSTTGTEAWRELGNFTAARAPGEQVFDMAVPMWARYVKFQILSHYGQEHYCTVSQIKVHGSTVLQGFHEQWQESQDGTDGGDDGVGDLAATEKATDDSAVPSGEARHLDNDAAIAGSPSEGEGGNATAVADPSTSLPPTSNLSAEVANVHGDAVSAEGAAMKQRLFSAYPWSVSVPVDGVCLRSAATATASRRHSDPRAAHEPLAASLRWKTTQLKLGLSTRSSDAESMEGFDSEHPMVASSARTENPPVPPMLQSPMFRLVERISSKFGWNINLDGLTPMVRYLSSRGDSPDGPKDDVSERAAGKVVSAKDLKLSELEPRHPETPVDKPVRDHAGDSAKDSMLVVEHTVVAGKGRLKAFSDLLERYPSASCLAKLESTVVRVSQMKRGGGGGHGSVAGAHPGAGMEPVFKTLTDEIKALQAGLVAYEEMSKESVACFQEVLLEVFADMELQRQLQNRRLERLEQDWFGAGWIIALRIHLFHMLSFLLRLLDAIFIHGIGVAEWSFRSAVFALLAVGAMVIFLAKRRLRRSTRSSECSVASSCASAAPDCSSQAEETPELVTVVHTSSSTPDVSPWK